MNGFAIAVGVGFIVIGLFMCGLIDLVRLRIKLVEARIYEIEHRETCVSCRFRFLDRRPHNGGSVAGGESASNGRHNEANR